MNNCEPTYENWEELSYREKVEYLTKNEAVADCSFVVGDGKIQKPKIFKCHKWLLCGASPYFDTMFNGDWKEGRNPQGIPLIVVRPDVFDKILHYIYFKDVTELENLALDILSQLQHFADQYMLPLLSKEAANLISDRLAKGNVSESDLMRLFKTAHNTCNEDLLEKCSKAIKSKCFIAPYYSSFYELDFPLFYEFLKVLQGNFSMMKLFQMIESYAKINGVEEIFQDEAKQEMDVTPKDTKIPTSNGVLENASSIENTEVEKKKVYVKLMLKLLDYTTMSPMEFISGPGQSNYLALAEKYETLKLICKKQHEAFEQHRAEPTAQEALNGPIHGPLIKPQKLSFSSINSINKVSQPFTFTLPKN